MKRIINLKNLFFLAILLFLTITSLYAESPLENWYFIEPKTLKGTLFGTLSKKNSPWSDFTLADSYREQTGKCIILSENGYREAVNYYLYDSIQYHDGHTKDFYDRYIPRWIESNGYTVDYDKIESFSPAGDRVSEAQKKLIIGRGCDLAVRMVNKGYVAGYVEIIEYFQKTDSFKYTKIPFLQ